MSDAKELAGQLAGKLITLPLDHCHDKWPMTVLFRLSETERDLIVAVLRSPSPSVPEREALRKLVFAARTSGGVAGRDDFLCSACDEAEAILAPHPDKRAGEDWQLVETAPADVDVLLAWKAFQVEWIQKIGYARCTRGGWIDGQATHWKPLSAPPSTPTKQPDKRAGEDT